MKITEKVSYIKGLAEGLSLDSSSAEGKVISAIIDALEAMAKEVTDSEGKCRVPGFLHRGD